MAVYHPMLEQYARALRDFFARRLTGEVRAIEAVEARPYFYGCATAPFSGATGQDLVLRVDGVETTITMTGDVGTTVVADINAAVAAVTASLDTQDDGQRLLIRHNTAATTSAPREIRVVGGGAAAPLGLVTGDGATEMAVPDLTRRHIHAHDPFSAGQHPVFPAIWVADREAENRDQSNEAIWDLRTMLDVVVTANRPEVAERQIDRIARGISQVIQTDRTIDCAVLGTFLLKRVQTPMIPSRSGEASIAAGATIELRAVYAEELS